MFCFSSNQFNFESIYLKEIKKKKIKKKNHLYGFWSANIRSDILTGVPSLTIDVFRICSKAPDAKSAIWTSRHKTSRGIITRLFFFLF